jgi:hypothetical protein
MSQYIPPHDFGASNVGAVFSRKRIDLMGQTWDHCVFEDCTIILYKDKPSVMAATRIDNCEFNFCCFAGDKDEVATLLVKAGHKS